MNYILTMSLSGSCLFIIYCLVRLCVGNRLKEGWYYGFLKVAMLYFLIPLPWLKKAYVWLNHCLKPVNRYASTVIYDQRDWILFVEQSGWKLNDTAKIQTNILGVWMTGTIVVGCFMLIYYYVRRYRLQELCSISEEGIKNQLGNDLAKAMEIRVPILFMKNAEGGTPFTIGLWKPIIFYCNQECIEEEKLMLRHELTHIKRKDIVWKFF